MEKTKNRPKIIAKSIRSTLTEREQKIDKLKSPITRNQHMLITINVITF